MPFHLLLNYTSYCTSEGKQTQFMNLVNTKVIVISGHGGLSISSAGSDSGCSDSKSTKVESMLVMSGGEGYIDFRIGIHYTYLVWLHNEHKLIHFALFCSDK